MGKKDTPAPPAAPDPYRTSAAQTQGDVSSAIANATLGNVNTTTPLGTQTFQQIGSTTIKDAQGNPIEVPRYSMTQTLSPEQQQLYNQQTQLGSSLNDLAINQTGRINELLGTPIDQRAIPQIATKLQGTSFMGAAPVPYLNNLQDGPDMSGAAYNPQFQNINNPQIVGNSPYLQTSFNPGSQNVQTSVSQSMTPTSFGATQGNVQYSVGPTDFTADRDATTAALMARLQPEMDRQRAALTTSLANQGLTPGSAAWNTQMDAFNRQVNDANMQAILAGNQEQNTLFGQKLAQGQFTNAAQNQDYSQQQGRGLFGMQATGQNNAASLNAGNFANSGVGQLFGQNQALANFYNSAQQQGFTNNLSAAGANNAARLAAAQFNNQNAQQAYQNLFNNSQQGFQNAQAVNAANNATAQQGYTNAQNAIDVNNQLSQQVFGNNQSQATFQNQAAQQALQQMLALRNQPINEITALMGAGQVTLPQFAGYNAPQIGGSTIAQNINQNAALANQQYNTQMQAQASDRAGLYSLGSSLIGAGGRIAMGSDRRLKRDIKIIGRHPNGLPIYEFKYLWSDKPTIGFMADEVEQIKPEAVINIGGYKAVYYDMVA